MLETTIGSQIFSKSPLDILGRLQPGHLKESEIGESARGVIGQKHNLKG